MPLAPRVRQPLHQQHTHTLAPARAVRRRGERLAPAVGRQPTLPAELDKRARRRHHRHTTGQRHIALPVPQRLRRQMQRHQRRRTRRVHRHRRPLKPERVRHPAGQDAAGVARAEEALDIVGHLVQATGVLVVHDAGEDAGPAAAHRLGRDTSPFERLPRRLQQQPLLRVHRQRLTRRHPEERRIELRRVVEEPALAGVGGAVPTRLRVVETVDVPATVGGEGADGIAAGAGQLPQFLGRVHPARVTAGHADYGDRLVVHGGHGQRRGGAGFAATDLGVDERGERGGRGVVEDQGGGQSQSRGHGEPVAQFHRCQ